MLMKAALLIFWAFGRPVRKMVYYRLRLWASWFTCAAIYQILLTGGFPPLGLSVQIK